MQTRTILLLVLFWTMQAAAQGAFGWGALASGRWLAGFVSGNVIGVCSIFVLMRLYSLGNAGLACALGVGGAFVAGQIAIALVSGTRPSLPQWGCIFLIAVGMIGYAQAASPSVEPTAPSGSSEIEPTSR
jgi:hypothetical protein